MQNFNAEVGLAENAKLIIVNSGGFNATTGNFMAQSLNGDECFVPAKVMSGAGFDKDSVKYPFYVVAKPRTYKWYVDKAGAIVPNPSAEDIASQGLEERSIVERMTAYAIFKTKEDAAANLSEISSGKVWIATEVKRRVKALALPNPIEVANSDASVN